MLPPGNSRRQYRAQMVPGQRFPQIAIALECVLARLSRRQIHRYEDQLQPRQHLAIGGKEPVCFRQMPAITHRRYHNHHPAIGDRRRCRRRRRQVVWRHDDAICSEPGRDMLGNAPGLAVTRRIEQQHVRHPDRATMTQAATRHSSTGALQYGCSSLGTHRWGTHRRVLHRWGDHRRGVRDAAVCPAALAFGAVSSPRRAITLPHRRFPPPPLPHNR